MKYYQLMGIIYTKGGSLSKMPNFRVHNHVCKIKGPFKVMACVITLWSFLFNILLYEVAWAGSRDSTLALDPICDEMKLEVKDGKVKIKRKSSPQTVMSADEFEEKLIDIFELDDRHTRRGSVHCQGRDYAYTMFETDLERYTWHMGPVYFRAGDIFVLNATVDPWVKGSYDEDWRRRNEQKKLELRRLLETYPSVIKLYEHASDHHNGGWLPYTDSADVSGRPYWLTHTIGVLVAMQANKGAIQGHTFVDAFSRNGLMANAAYILGASDTVVIENDPQEINTFYLQYSIKNIELPETTDLIRANLMINGNLDSSRIYYKTIRQVPEEEFENAVLSFSDYDFGFGYKEASQTDIAEARNKAPLGILKWGSWLYVTPEGEKIMASKRESLLRDIREKFRGVRWIIASGGTEAGKLESWGITQRLIDEAKSLSLILHSQLEIRHSDTVVNEDNWDSRRQTLIMPTLTFYDGESRAQILPLATPVANEATRARENVQKTEKSL